MPVLSLHAQALHHGSADRDEARACGFAGSMS